MRCLPMIDGRKMHGWTLGELPVVKTGVGVDSFTMTILFITTNVTCVVFGCIIPATYNILNLLAQLFLHPTHLILHLLHFILGKL